MTVDEYKKNLYHPRVDKYQLLRALKDEGDYDKIKKVLRHISGHPIVKSIFVDNIRYKAYGDLRKAKIVPFSNNFIGEASFYLLVFEQNKEVIDKFIRLKEEFECKILLGEYNKAETLLAQIDNDCGKSMWLIENQILLKELSEGVKANWNEVSDFSKKVTNPLVLLLVENLSKRAESRISYFRYVNILNNQIGDLSDNILFEYLCFRLNYLGYTSYENFSYILFIESGFATIDKYLIFNQIISELFNSRFQDRREELKDLVNKLALLFPSDKTLAQKYNILFPTSPIDFDQSSDIYEYIDSYSRGNIDFCCEKGLELISRYPIVIELHEIFAKAMVESKREFVTDGLSSTMKDLLQTLIDIYSNNPNLDQIIDQGLKISMSFYSTSWAKQYLSLVSSASAINNGNKHFNLHYVLNSVINNPRVLYYSNTNDREHLVSHLKKMDGLSLTTDILNQIIKGNYNFFEENHVCLPNVKQQMFFGRALMAASEFEIARKHFEDLYPKKDQSELFTEEVLVNLFRCYVKLNLNREACCLFVDNYLLTQQRTKRLNKDKLLWSLENSHGSKLKELIEVPIFYRIATDDTFLQYVAYDNYITSKEVNRPTEFLENVKIFDSKLIYFLREVCTIEIMHHSYHFNGTDDLESERLNILNRLIANDKAHEKIYIKEITELTQNANIRKAIREVNKGRITVNVEQLKNLEMPNVREAFNRYQEIESYIKDKKDIVGIDSTNMLQELNVSIDDLDISKVVFTSDPAFISFKVIFIEIRDKFILSKECGLDGYLSTRIRHGTLLNHIRSVFESENIISQRDKDNNYLDINFWNKNLPTYLQEKRTRIQDAMRKFSRAIDEYTEFIIKEQIQVRTEKHGKKPRALFDFSMSNKDLAVLFTMARQDIKDHNTFLNFVFEYLQTTTEDVLLGIRNYINEDVKNNYNKILQDFNTEIKDIIGIYNYPELMSSISLCGTKIQNELKNISEWFYLSNSTKDLTLDLKILIQTAVQITNTISPVFRINPVITEDTSIPTFGTVHLIYLCRILLDNIIRHSKLEPEELRIEINSQYTADGFLKLSFKNNFSESLDKKNLNEILAVVKSKWDVSSDDYENIDIEGGSGFEKIRRIIAFDLDCSAYKFDYLIEDECLTVSIYMNPATISKYEN